MVAGLVAVTLWGSAFVAIRDAGETLAPGSLALGRLLVSLVVLGAAAAIWRAPLPERRDLAGIAAFSVLFLGVYSVTLNEAERRVDTPLARWSSSRGASAAINADWLGWSAPLPIPARAAAAPATAGLSWWLGLAVAPTLGGQLLAVSASLPLIGGAVLAASAIVLLRASEPALPVSVRSIPQP
jgi:EamA-like transporter family